MFSTNLLIYQFAVSDGRLQHVKMTEAVRIRVDVERHSQMDFKEGWKSSVTFNAVENLH